MKTRTGHAHLLRTLLVLAFSAIVLSARGQSTAYLYDAPGRLTSITPQSPGAPTIVVPPAVHLLSGNGNASFSVVAAGSGTLSYQWLSNGVPVPGAMNDTLVITNLTVPGNLVSNGGFETPIVLDDYVLHPAGQNLGGWVIESGNVDLCHSVWISAEGAQSLDLNGTTIGIVYQDVPTLPGQQYFLRYALAGNVYAGFAVKTNAVWWDGAPLATNTFNITGRSTADMGWTNREYAVTATAANTRIRFVSQSTTAAGSVLDDVTLIPVTPPPAAFSVIVSNAGGSVTSLVATVEFDLDRNGLADSWERNYFGATGQLNLGDHDGDGVSNQDEFLDGTDPTQPASFNPRLNLAVSGNGSVHAAPLQLSYEFNDLVPLRAIPGADSLFIRWRGLTNTSPEVNLVMNSTKNLTAEFGLTLTNGTTQDGTVQRGGTNTYAFMMNAGDTVIFRGGELSGSVSFAPWLRIYGLNGALLDSDANASDAYVEYRATNSGTFSLTVSSTGSLQTGDYRLSFTKAPGTFVILPGDEGGSLTNGANHDGITALGDEDLWTFNATAGNNIVLRCGQLAGAGPNGYFPYLRLYGPTGALLANVANDNDTYLTYQTTNSGTFAVVVGSYYRGDTGAYRLRLMQVPGAFVISPGDDGGALTNGANHDGVSDLGDEDLWTFTANAKDSIVLRCGQLSGAGPNGYYPYLRLYGPTGALLANVANDNDTYLAYQTTNGGTFTVLVGSYYAGDNGSYRLRFMQVPGAFVVATGDEGGALTNGANHDGVIDLGDEDIWTFPAAAGNNIVLRCGELSGAGPNAFYPYLRLYGPTGALLATEAQASDAFLSYQATNSGVFTVLVGSYYAGDHGSYRLRLASMPGNFVVPAGDEGGLLAPQIHHEATNDLGDEDLWTFTAYKGAVLNLRVEKSGGAASYNPWARLYGSNGALLASGANANPFTLTYTPTNHGRFTLLMGSFYAGYTGSYRLSGTNISEGLKLSLAKSGGTNLNLGGAGGASNVSYLVHSTTNLAQSAALWSLVVSNRFDASGAFSLSNLFNPAQREQYFRLSVP